MIEISPKPKKLVNNLQNLENYKKWPQNLKVNETPYVRGVKWASLGGFGMSIIGFLEEKNIKMKQNHISSLVFNRDELRKFNWTNLM